MNEPPGPQGFVMPAEWTPHRATWIAWPHQKRDWPGKFEPIPWVTVEIVRHLSRGEPVAVLVPGRTVRAAAARMLRRAGVNLRRVEFHAVPTDRAWTRDSGPTIVRRADGERRAVLWRFNGWAKYANHRRDARVGRAIARIAGIPAFRATARGVPVVMEGGAIDTDGEGTLLTTEECLLSRRVQCRNPGLGRHDLERIFAEALGVRKVLWLGRGIAGDDTHGHVDDLARFVGPARVVLCREDNPKDPNYRPLEENRERLQGARDASGRRIEVIPLPMPAPLLFEGMRLPASYANFYIANGRVLVPTFNDPRDRAALGLLAELFPDREVVGIHCVDFVWGLGTLHCATQQEPR
ncbi:MAG TPA: agmatine deiminase family protein [Planctomycetota bacterium]|jgi:agmatine deiminase|nr:agmatine deiminase family protein [Planctomycetota bacterium]